MTVEELIAILQEHPSELRVVVNGYEDGYDDLTPEQIDVISIALNTDGEEWQGVHSDADGTEEQVRVAQAVVLRRTSQ